MVAVDQVHSLKKIPEKLKKIYETVLFGKTIS